MYVLNSVEKCVRQAFCKDFLDINDSCLKLYWCREKSFIDCDLCVHLQTAKSHFDDALKQQLQVFCKSLLASSEVWEFPLISCVVTGSMVKLKLRRTQLMKFVATKVDQLKKDYGSASTSEHREPIVVIVDEEEGVDSLNGLRCSLITEFVCGLLESNGYDLSFTNIDKCFDSTECKFACDSHRKRFESRLDAMKVSEENGREVNQRSSITNKELEGVVQLEHLIDHVKQPNTLYIWIVSHRKQHKWKVAERIRWKLMSNGGDFESERTRIKHAYLVYGHTTGEFKSSSELQRSRKLEIANAAGHKLKSAGSEESGQQSDVDVLTDLCIKFDLLSISSINPVKLSNESLKEGNQGAFIMYNYARIVALLKSFQDAVNQRIYSSLPDVSQIDFSLLNRNEEWNLMMSCAFYPSFIRNIISELIKESDSKPPIHQLLRYTVKFSHDLSVYYNRIHILNEAATHLQATMHARIWLLMSIKQILENIFNLLNIEPLSRM